jgi:hypothetical protein
MTDLTWRLSNRIGRDFPPGTAEKVRGYLAGLGADAFDGQDPERIQAAVVLGADGKWEQFIAAFRLLKVDWRDVLVAGGLANADWRDRLNAELSDS